MLHVVSICSWLYVMLVSICDVSICVAACFTLLPYVVSICDASICVVVLLLHVVSIGKVSIYS